MNLVVVYSSDDNYAQHTGVSIVSLLDNNKHFTSIRIYVIDNEISECNKTKLRNIIRFYKREIIFIDFNTYKSILKLNMEWEISISSYARLFISSMLPDNIDKVLYFDCDTIIVNKLDELWSLNIDNYYIAAVQDTISNSVKSSIGLTKKYKYINAGMLLINLKLWREENIQEEFMKFIDKHNGNVIHHDQGVLNGVLHSNIKIISPKFNLMSIYYMMKRSDIIEYYNIEDEFYSEKEIIEAINSVVYIHFTPSFTTRPWVKKCKHPRKKEYFKYMELSPWKDYKVIKDNSEIKIKFINYLYSNLPFKLANKINEIILKILKGVKNG